jgi:hypothetical protein
MNVAMRVCARIVLWWHAWQCFKRWERLYMPWFSSYAVFALHIIPHNLGTVIQAACWTCS